MESAEYSLHADGKLTYTVAAADASEHRRSAADADVKQEPTKY